MIKIILTQDNCYTGWCIIRCCSWALGGTDDDDYGVDDVDSDKANDDDDTYYDVINAIYYKGWTSGYQWRFISLTIGWPPLSQISG